MDSDVVAMQRRSAHKSDRTLLNINTTHQVWETQMAWSTSESENFVSLLTATNAEGPQGRLSDFSAING